jgi:type II secretory pathway component PulF
MHPHYKFRTHIADQMSFQKDNLVDWVLVVLVPMLMVTVGLLVT